VVSLSLGRDPVSRDFSLLLPCLDVQKDGLPPRGQRDLGGKCRELRAPHRRLLPAVSHGVEQELGCRFVALSAVEGPVG